MTKVRFVWDDDGDGLLRVGRGVHADVGDEVTRFVDRFQALEGDVLYKPPPKTEKEKKRKKTYLISLLFLSKTES